MLQASHEIELDVTGFDQSDDTLYVIVRNKANRLPIGRTLVAACQPTAEDEAEAAAGAAAAAAVAAAVADSAAAEDGDSAPVKRMRVESK